jgi:hypothetical protein
MNRKKNLYLSVRINKISICRKVLKVVRLGEMDADQTVDSVREAELLSNLHNEHIVKVKKAYSKIDFVIEFEKYF